MSSVRLVTTKLEDKIFLGHGSCSACGSRDNVSWYKKPSGRIDGYCHGCSEYYIAKSEEEVKLAKIYNKAIKGTPTNFVNFPDDFDIKPYLFSTTQSVYPYKDARGSVLFYIIRYLVEGKKQFTPLSFDGKEVLYRRRPIKTFYNMESLTDNNKPVLIVEGEKAVEAAKKKLPKVVPISWQGGAGNIEAGDWEVLKGRTVYLFPDKDTAGEEAMDKIAKLLPKCDVWKVDTSQLEDKQDIADDIDINVLKNCFMNKIKIKDNNFKEGRATLESIQSDIKSFPNSFINIDLDGAHIASLKCPGISTIEGRSGHGKSTLMLNMAIDALRKGKSVSIFNYEMTSTEVVTRLLMSVRGEVLSNNNSDNYLEYIEDVSKLISTDMREIADYINRGKLDIFGSDSVVVYDATKLVKYIDDFADDQTIIMIDYIQILPVDSNYNVPQYKVIKDLVYLILPAVAKKRCHAILGSQLTGDSYNTIFDSPRESKDITNVASLSLRVWNKNTPVHRKLVEEAEKTEDYRNVPYNNIKGDFIIETSKNRWGSHYTKGFNLIAGSRLERPTTKNNLTTDQKADIIKEKINDISTLGSPF